MSLHGGTVVQLHVRIAPCARGPLPAPSSTLQFLRRRVRRKLLRRQIEDDAVVVQQQAVARRYGPERDAALVERNAADQPAVEKGADDAVAGAGRPAQRLEVVRQRVDTAVLGRRTRASHHSSWSDGARSRVATRAELDAARRAHSAGGKRRRDAAGCSRPIVMTRVKRDDARQRIVPAADRLQRRQRSRCTQRPQVMLPARQQRLHGEEVVVRERRRSLRPCSARPGPRRCPSASSYAIGRRRHRSARRSR